MGVNSGLSDLRGSQGFWKAYRNQPADAELKALTITGAWERLNRIKGTNSEAFWYWCQASRLA